MREYEVQIGGLPHTLLLDDETAKRYGDRASEVKRAETKKAPEPANKARTARDK